MTALTALSMGKPNHAASLGEDCLSCVSIIESPDVCIPALEGLLCQEGRLSHCLNEEQLQRANAIFHPVRYPDGKLIFPRAQPGSELRASAIYLNGRPHPAVNVRRS